MMNNNSADKAQNAMEKKGNMPKEVKQSSEVMKSKNYKLRITFHRHGYKLRIILSQHGYKLRIIFKPESC